MNVAKTQLREIKDAQRQEIDRLQADNIKLRKEVESMRENHIMQLAGISTACIQNTKSTIKDRIPKDNPYWTVAYGDVCVAVDREMRERKRAEEAELLAHYKDETATTFMNQVKKLQSELAQAHSDGSVMRDACQFALSALELLSDTPSFTIYGAEGIGLSDWLKRCDTLIATVKGEVEL